MPDNSLQLELRVIFGAALKFFLLDRPFSQIGSATRLNNERKTTSFQ